MAVWLDEWDAQRYVGRSDRTLRRWRNDGLVRVGKRQGKWVYEKASLKIARKEADRRYRERRIVPGAGRGKKRSRPEDLIPLFCL